MQLRPTHELHLRRFSRNLGLGLTLAAFVVLVFALTVVKIGRGAPMQGYGQAVQPQAVPTPAVPTPAVPTPAVPTEEGP